MIPTEMKHSVFITLPKKPQAMICTEFRTISLMSHVTKLLLKIVQQRMANKIDKGVSRLQSGFRPGTGTRGGIFNLRTICERATDVQKGVYICFIDYTKDFDRVKHFKMIECLSEIGIDDKDLQIITKRYHFSHHHHYRTTQRLLPPSNIVYERSPSGDTLSPVMFTAAVEDIFKRMNMEAGINISGVRQQS